MQVTRINKNVDRKFSKMRLSWGKAFITGVLFGILTYLVPVLLIKNMASNSQQSGGFIDGIGPAIVTAMIAYAIYSFFMVITFFACSVLLLLLKFKTARAWLIVFFALITVQISTYLFYGHISSAYDSVSLLASTIIALGFSLIFVILLKIYDTLLVRISSRFIGVMIIIGLSVLSVFVINVPTKIITEKLAEKSLIDQSVAAITSVKYDVYASTNVPSSSMLDNATVGSNSGNYVNVQYDNFNLYSFAVEGDNYPPLNCVQPEEFSADVLKNRCSLFGKDSTGGEIYIYTDDSLTSYKDWTAYKKVGNSVVVLVPRDIGQDPSFSLQKNDILQIMGSLQKQTPTTFRDLMRKYGSKIET